MKKDVVIIGGGPAGLAAAIALYDRGITDILILEREKHLGGILRQCIHDGFGLTRFGETLSGPEYADRFISEVKKRGIDYRTETTVIGLTEDRQVTAASREGLLELRAGAVILAMGCRERTRGALSIPGNRPSGVMTAGVAQSYINLKNRMIGKNVVILGSGDIGLIMARRLTLEGARVIGVFELMPYAAGLPRNIEQCLRDYDIPLYLHHSVTEIRGRERLESVVVSEMDDALQPVPGTEKEYACDTLILSVGLIPENELTFGAGAEENTGTRGASVDEFFQTSVPGIFAAGNVLHVHDLVDFVSLEAEALAAGAEQFIRNGSLPESRLRVSGDALTIQLTPERISGRADAVLSFRVKKPIGSCEIQVLQQGRVIRKVKKPKAIPAEMIQIPISAGTLSTEGDVEVKVLC